MWGAAANHPEALAAQDTTLIDLSSRDRARRDLRPAGDRKSPGYFCHGMVAIDAAAGDAPMGVVGCADSDAAGRNRYGAIVAGHREQGIDPLDRRRGGRGRVARQHPLLIIIGDRGSDIDVQFARPPAADLIVRGHDCKLADDEQPSMRRRIGAASGAMINQLAVSRPADTGRTASVEVKALAGGCMLDTFADRIETITQ